MFNSVLSQRNARFACFDIKNFYLGTPLDHPGFVKIRLTNIPQEFIHKYNLQDCTHDGWVYFEISNGVYNLKQAGKQANDLLTTRLANVPPRQDYGTTNGGPSWLSSLLTTLDSNTVTAAKQTT